VARRRTVKDVLVAAMQKLETYGWIQDASGRRSTGYCMTGAINASTRDLQLSHDAIVALDAVLTERGWSIFQSSPYPMTRVQNFNDRVGRRKQTILAIYRRAIKAAA
jgi:hypothetical protein